LEVELKEYLVNNVTQEQLVSRVNEGWLELHETGVGKIQELKLYRLSLGLPALAPEKLCDLHNVMCPDSEEPLDPLPIVLKTAAVMLLLVPLTIFSIKKWGNLTDSILHSFVYELGVQATSFFSMLRTSSQAFSPARMS
jgi:hypothetical protein